MIEITNIIQTMPDGNCLFYCISAFLDKSLYNCNRDEFGCPKSKKLKEKERYLSKNLRMMTVFKMETIKYLFKDSIDYDDELYDSIDDRINKMKRNKTWGGFPELKTLSEMLSINFHVYVKYENEDKVNLISDIGKQYRDNQCSLLLDNSHFELIDIFHEENIEKDQEPNISNKRVIPIKIKKKEYIDGYLIENINENDIDIFKGFSIKENNIKEECGFYIKKKNAWFFWGNIDKFRNYCLENNVDWC
jgi:hypothetical protein